MSDVPDSTTNRWRPVAVSITSSLLVDETTVPVMLVVAVVPDVVADAWAWSLWADTGPARASDKTAATQNKRLFRISPPLADRCQRAPTTIPGCKAGATALTRAQERTISRYESMATRSATSPAGARVRPPCVPG
jgi:hypothetical protein